MKKVLCMFFYFPPVNTPPSYRALGFIRHLKNFGWEPIVLTVEERFIQDHQMDYSLCDWIPSDIKVYRTEFLDFETLRIEEGKESKFVTFISYLDSTFRGLIGSNVPDSFIGWFPFAYEKAKEIIEREEIELVFTSSNPYTSSLIGLKLKEEFFLPWIAEFRDPWSQNDFLYANKQTKNKRVVHKAIEKKILEKCDDIIVVGSNFKRMLCKEFNLNYRKVSCITNGYDEEYFKEIEKEGIKSDNSSFRILYTGTFYEKLNKPTDFLEALNDLVYEKKLPHFEFRVIGMGGKWIERYLGTASNQNLKEYITLVPQISPKESLKEMLSANALLLSIPKEYLWISTSKIFSYLRARKPILAIIPEEGDAASILKNYPRSVMVDPGDLEGIKSAILNLYHQWDKNKEISSYSYIERGIIQKYEWRELTAELANIFDEVVEKYRDKEELIKKGVSEGFLDSLGEKILPFYYNVASSLEKSGEFEKAFEIFSQIIEKKEDEIDAAQQILAGAYFHNGTILKALGRNKEAVKSFEKCLEIMPEHKKAKESVSACKE